MSVVEAARRSLGPVGVYVPVPFTRWIPMDEQREAVRRLERAGYRTTWCNEAIGGKDVFAQLAVLLAATERMTFATGIANIWARAPQTTHGAAALLSEAYPGRLVLALGVGYPEQAASVGREFGRPLSTMRTYLEDMSAPPQLPGPSAPYARLLGAMGPKLLALSGEAADGAYPANQPPEFITEARRSLGPDKLLVSGVAVGAEDKPDDVAATVHTHLAAGADHVTLLPSTTGTFESDVTHLTDLAPALA